MDDLCLILQSAVENFENFMNATPEKAKSNFARAAQFFCRFLCRCFSRLKLLSYTFNGENVDRVLVRLFSLPLIFTLHLIGGQEHFLFCHRRHKIFMLFFQQKNVSFFFYLWLSISVVLFVVELRWSAADRYFLFFSVFLLLYIPNLCTWQLI